MIEHDVTNAGGVYARQVAFRRVIYLDSNIWIDLTEAKAEAAAETVKLARLAQRSRCAIFPLGYASITELLKQPLGEVSRRQGQLMDELSEGVSLRGPGQLRALEVRGVHNYLMTGTSERQMDQAFTVIACYLGDGSLEYPPGTPPALAADMTATITRNLPGLTWLHERFANAQFRSRYATGEKEWVEEIRHRNQAAYEAFQNSDGSLNAKRLRLEEHTYVFREQILRLLPRLVGPAAMVQALTHFKTTGVRDSAATLARVIATMPAEALSCEMHVQRRLARDRAPRPQDMFDYDHASFGVSYSDAFATADRELVDLLRRSKARTNYSCEILRGVKALRSYLSRLLDERTVGVSPQ